MKNKGLINKSMFFSAIIGSIKRLHPISLIRNPVMFVVEICAIIVTGMCVYELICQIPYTFSLQIGLWLWITVLFSNFAESLAEGKGKAQAEHLKQTKSEINANKVDKMGKITSVPALSLEKGDIVLVESGQLIPSDGEIIEGVALLDESAITGESAPVIRESGGDRTGVTGGTKLLSGKIKIKITVNPGETFLDQMIGMIESSKRKKTPNEISLEILLMCLTVLFIIVTATLPIFSKFSNVTISLTVLVSLLVCLMPTTIGGLLPAIGIAGMDRLLSCNVIALTGKAVEAAGDVNIVLLDKTGTITLGNRLATQFIPAEGVKEEEIARLAMLSSLADETPEGRSIVVLAKEKLNIRGRDIRAPKEATFMQFDPKIRISGVNIGNKQVRKGAFDAIELFASKNCVKFPQEVRNEMERIAREGGTPLIVADQYKVYGTIHLKDVLKVGIKERLLQLQNIGISSVMITGDNPLTAAAIAAEAGVNNFVAQATPETKMQLIKKYQENGYMVAMIGDGTNDAPALAVADVAVAMNVGTQAAREAANMIDLDSSPTKLLDIVEVGKQILITRGALTTFSISNDLAKYFAMIPALFFQYPALQVLNLMHLSSPKSAILSAVIFNALIIPMLIPLALKGVKTYQNSVVSLLRKNLLLFGLGGLLLPFIAIKGIDIVVNFLFTCV